MDIIPEEIQSIILSNVDHDWVFVCACVSPGWLRLCTQVIRQRYIGDNNDDKMLSDRILSYTPDILTLHFTGHTKITDNGLRYLTKIAELRIGVNQQFVTAKGIQQLTTLTRLASDVPVCMDIDITTLSNLQSLSMHHKTLIDDHDLSQMTRLKFLSLYGSATISDHGISTLTNLRSINCAATRLITIDGLKCLPQLTHLDLSVNRVISTIGTLTSLTSLRLRSNSCVTDQELMQLTNLKMLDIWGRGLITGKSLSQLTGLVKLDLSHNTDIHDRDLCTLTGLKILSLVGNCMITTAAVAKLPLLQQLDLTGNHMVIDKDLPSGVKIRRDY